jgi:hypothetical protein
MNTHPESDKVSDPVASTTTDQTRRKLTTAGIAGTGVLLSVASRSAMGGWGQCTGSELASGNLSRTGDPNPCGCSPGYWWNNNGLESWGRYLESKYSKTASFNEVFNVRYFKERVTLQMLSPGSKHEFLFEATNGSRKPKGSETTNGLDNVAMHAVAALLNAEFYGTRYPAGFANGASVITAFQNAFNGPGDKSSNLKNFVAKVDVYTSQSTWCFGEKH